MKIMTGALAFIVALSYGQFVFAGDGDEQAPPAITDPDQGEEPPAPVPPPPEQGFQGAPPLPPPEYFSPQNNYVCDNPDGCSPLPLPDGTYLTPVPFYETYYYYLNGQRFIGRRLVRRNGYGNRGYAQPSYGARGGGAGYAGGPTRQAPPTAGRMNPGYAPGGLRPQAPAMGRPGGFAPPVAGGRGRPMMGGAPRGGGFHRAAFTGCEIQHGNNGQVVVLGADDQVLFDRSTPKALESAEVVKKMYEATSSQCGFSAVAESKSSDI